MILKRLIRFVAVGIFNTAFGYAVYAAMIYVGLVYAAASLVSLIASLFVGYFATGRLVFGHRSTARMPHYFAAYGATYLINISAIALFLRAGLDAYLAGLAAVPPTALSSYLILHFLVFPARHLERPSESSAEHRACRASGQRPPAD